MNARAAVLAAAATSATIGLALLGEPARTYRDYDFGTFWVMGRMVLEGKDQYDYATFLATQQAIGSQAFSLVLPGTASAYPLTTAFVFVPFALLPFGLAAPLWLVAQLLVAGLALTALARVLVPDTVRRDAFVVIGLLVASQPVWLLVQYGNMSGLILAIAAAAAALLMSGRAAAAGVFAGALLLIKPHLLLLAMVLIAVALARRVAARVIVSATLTVALVGAASIALDPTWVGRWVSQLAHVAAFGVGVRLPTLFGLIGPGLLWLSVAVSAGLVVSFLAWVRTRPPLPLASGAAVCVSLFISPFGHSYDHVILAIPMLVVLAEVRAAATLRRLTALVVLAIAFVVTPWLLYAVAFRRGDESLNAMTPLALLMALALGAWLGRQSIASAPHDMARRDPPVPSGA